jgi:hypothetical protein
MDRSLPENRTGSGRRPDGTFAPGCSGNAGGRPKTIETVRDLARAHTQAALETLVEIASSGESESARVSAASAILDRGWGKPTQPLAGDAEMAPIDMTVEDKSAEIARRQAEAKAILDRAFGGDGT